MIQSADAFAHRVGRFRVSKEIIETNPYFVMLALQNILILSVVYDSSKLQYTYIGLSDEFKYVKYLHDADASIPDYQINLKVKDGQEIRTVTEL